MVISFLRLLFCSLTQKEVYSRVYTYWFISIKLRLAQRAPRIHTGNNNKTDAKINEPELETLN